MKKILVVDDDEAILEVIKIILEDNGYEVWDDNVGDFFDKNIRKQPDLVLLDILLEGRSGLEICKAIKNDKGWNSIPVILVSAHTESEVKQVAKSCGADGVITKPFEIDELLNTVRETLQRFESYNE